MISRMIVLLFSDITLCHGVINVAAKWCYFNQLWLIINISTIYTWRFIVLTLDNTPTFTNHYQIERHIKTSPIILASKFIKLFSHIKILSHNVKDFKSALKTSLILIHFPQKTNILGLVKSKDFVLSLSIFNTNLLFTFDNLMALTIFQLHINFITHACAFIIYVLILALLFNYI
jgi:hypothetical protein